MAQAGHTKACMDCGAPFLPTGKGGRCLPCRRIWDADWRARRKAEGRPVVPSKMPRDYHVAYEADYYQRPEVRQRRAQLARERLVNPSERPKHEARWAVRRAIAAGKIDRQPCEVCGASQAHAHHDDYSRPLDVRWLCPPHHREHHKAEGRS